MSRGSHKSQLPSVCIIASWIQLCSKFPTGVHSNQRGLHCKEYLFRMSIQLHYFMYIIYIYLNWYIFCSEYQDRFTNMLCHLLLIIKQEFCTNKESLFIQQHLLASDLTVIEPLWNYMKKTSTSHTKKLNILTNILEYIKTSI